MMNKTKNEKKNVNAIWVNDTMGENNIYNVHRIWYKMCLKKKAMTRCANEPAASQLPKTSNNEDDIFLMATQWQNWLSD